MLTNIKDLLLKNKKNYKAITIDNNSDDNLILNKIAEYIANNADIIEIKATYITTKKFLNISKKARELCSNFDKLLIIYDRLDIAKLIDSDGIVLDKNSANIDDILNLIKKDMLLGVYVENDKDIIQNQEYNIDFWVTNNKKLSKKDKIFYID